MTLIHRCCVLGKNNIRFDKNAHTCRIYAFLLMLLIFIASVLNGLTDTYFAEYEYELHVLSLDNVYNNAAHK